MNANGSRPTSLTNKFLKVGCIWFEELIIQTQPKLSTQTKTDELNQKSRVEAAIQTLCLCLLLSGDNRA